MNPTAAVYCCCKLGWLSRTAVWYYLYTRVTRSTAVVLLMSFHIQRHSRSHTVTPHFNFHLALQNFRISVEHGAASLLGYLSSVEVRGDTKLSLGIGVLAGLAVVAAIAAYPGKPIDYTGVGESHSLLCKSESLSFPTRCRRFVLCSWQAGGLWRSFSPRPKRPSLLCVPLACTATYSSTYDPN